MAMAGNTRQWSLKALLLVPLLLSPLFLSANLIRRQYFTYGSDFTTLLNTFACAAAYAGIFTWRAMPRQRPCEGGPRHLIVRGAVVGAGFGLVFMGLAVGPPLASDAVGRISDQRVVLMLLLKRFGMFVVLFGTFLGAFGGTAACMILECVSRREARAHRVD